MSYASGRRALLAVALLMALLGWPAPALAADLRQAREITIEPGQTVSDDVYASGAEVDVAGTVDGSLIVAAGTVKVSGKVTRDLLVAGGNVTVPGEVEGSIRALGGTIDVTGVVGEDLVVAGGTLTLGTGARVGRDLLLGAGTAVVSGNVGRQVRAAADQLTLRGSVGGDVHAEVTRLRLEYPAVIGGGLSYASDDEASIAPGVRVSGNIARTARPGGPQASLSERFLRGLVDWLRALVGLMALGLVVVLALPRLSGRAAESLRSSPLRSLVAGLALLIGVPVVVVLLFALGVLVGGWWLALVVAALYAIALVVGYVLTGLALGRGAGALVGWPGLHPLLALLVGLLFLTLVGLIPIAGPLITAVAVVFGLGAVAVAIWRGQRSPAG